MKIRSIFIVENSVFYHNKIDSQHSTALSSAPSVVSDDTILGVSRIAISTFINRCSRPTLIVQFGFVILITLILQSCQPVSSKKSSSKSKSKSPSSLLVKGDSLLPTSKASMSSKSNDEHDDKHSGKSSPDTSELSAKRKIPTLREQMERVQAQQNLTNTKLDSLQVEVLSLKDDIAELKNRSASQPASTTESQTKPKSTKTKKSTPTLKGESVQTEEVPNQELKSQQGTSEIASKQGESRDANNAKSKKSNSGLILPDDGTSEGEKTDKKKQSAKQDSGIILPDNEQENQPSKTTKKPPTIVREIKPNGGMTEEDIVDNISSSAKQKSSGAKRAKTKSQSVRQLAKAQNTDGISTESSSTKSSAKTSSELPPPIKETAKEQVKESAVDVANTASPTANTPSSNGGASGSASYNTALALFAKKQYSEAINLLSEITTKEKSGTTVANAYYWMAESYFGMGKYADAIKHFDKVLELKSPQKSDDALAGIAEAQAKNGNTTEAKKVYQRLLSQYPQSDYVAQARKRLQQL